MDSEHRHELKSNELANLITHFPQFVKRNLNTIIGFAIIVIALVTWPLFTKMSKQNTVAQESQITNAIQMLNQDIRMALQAYDGDPEQLNPTLNTVLANANALLEQASETDNPNLQALAYIKAAQAIRTELHLRRERISGETVDVQIQKARQAYEKAVELADTANLKAMAQFGIGLCAEESGQTEQAVEIYNSIVTDDSFAATVFPTLAQQRIDNMGDYTVAFTFEEVEDEAIDALLSYPESATIGETITIEGDADVTPVFPAPSADPADTAGDTENAAGQAAQQPGEE